LDVERVSANGPILITSASDRIRRFLAKFGDDDTMFEEPTVYLGQR
jgi:hypothetical protein